MVPVAMLPQTIFNAATLSADRTRRLHLKGFKRATIWVLVTALNGAPSAATLNVTVNRKAPRLGTTYVDVAPSVDYTQISQATGLPDQQRIVLEEDDMDSEDLQIVFDVEFTDGTSPSWTISCAIEAML